MTIRLLGVDFLSVVHGDYSSIWHRYGDMASQILDARTWTEKGGFRGWAIECCQLHFSPTDPRCHGNEIWDKMGYNSACVRNFCSIFVPIRGFWGWAIECCQLHFSSTDHRCHGNKFWNKIGYNSPRVSVFLFSFPYPFPLSLPFPFPLSFPFRRMILS